MNERETTGQALYHGLANNVAWAKDKVTELAKSVDGRENDTSGCALTIGLLNNVAWAHSKVSELAKSSDQNERSTAAYALSPGYTKNVAWAKDKVTELVKSVDQNERSTFEKVIELGLKNNQPWAPKLQAEFLRVNAVPRQIYMTQNQTVPLNMLQQPVYGNQGIAPMQPQMISCDVYTQLQTQFRESQSQLFFANQEIERLKRELEEARWGKK